MHERDNLPLLIDGIRAHAPALDILVVDDNSPDGTGRLAEQLREQAPDRLFVLHRNTKQGLGRAYVDGFREGLKRGYDVLLQMDADLSHDPRHLPDFLRRIEDAELVIGSRYLRGISVVNWDLKRLLLSKMATAYVRLITRMQVLAPGGPRAGGSREGPVQRLPLPDRNHLQSLSPGRQGRGDPHHFRGAEREGAERNA